MARRRERRPRRVRRVYILPNLFTALNMFLGLLVIYNVYMAQFEPRRLQLACWIGLVAGLLDVLDGALARLTHSTSNFGAEFDSMADLVSFGVAPSLGAFHMMRLMGETPDRIVAAFCALFAICGGLRLARYNVQMKSSERRGFIGLPIPGGAGGVMVSILLIDRYGLLERTGAILPGVLGPDVSVASIIATVFPILVVALSLLMVSEIPYPHLTQRLRLRRPIPFQMLVAVLMVGVLIWALTREELVALLFVMGWCYILIPPAAALVRLLKGARRAEPATASAAGEQKTGKTPSGTTGL